MASPALPVASSPRLAGARRRASRWRGTFPPPVTPSVAAQLLNRVAHPAPNHREWGPMSAAWLTCGLIRRRRARLLRGRGSLARNLRAQFS